MTKPAVLRDPLDRATRFMFTRIITSLARLVRDEDLSVTELAALHLLDEKPDLRQSELARQLALSPSVASRMIDGLVGRELIVRQESPEDRRARHVRLTSRGHQMLDTIAAARVELFERLTRGVPRMVLKIMLGRVEHLRTTWEA